ncbi:MAG: hypothetical protein ACFFD2_20890 [Promethearchaeota archaeon]
MNEYDNEEFNEGENKLENGFEPFDEKINVKGDDFDYFVPMDELESINEILEAKFEPRDELRNEKVRIEDAFTPKNEKSTQKLREMIRNIDWNVITTDWKINLRKNQYPATEIQLNPRQDCSRVNPLYKHRIWLETVYTNKELNLTDKKISEICGVHLDTIQRWRKIHNISAKDWTNGKWVDERGYVKLLMPKDYLHPELVPIKGRNVRMEHVIVMEKYLSKHPELEWSKKYLIDGKYLKLGTIVHHINFNKSDNRLENLWLSENIKSHKKVESTLNECFRDLIKLNQIGFKNENYYKNNNFDCRDLSSSRIKEILEPISINPYKDINLIKEEIKKINWNEISDNWIVKIYKNQNISEKEIKLDPYSDCTDKNPLYMHREWVNRLVHDKEFNLTVRRLADLCGVDRGVIHYWSKVKHKINMENEKRGFGRYQHSAGGIWMRVPENYENPIAKNNKGWMYEHRYTMERYLADNPELDLSKKYLIDGKYLKSDCIVHHINFDPLDNRLENLWICENQIEHRKLETSLTPLIDDLIRSNHISFRNGEYILNLKKRTN